MASHGKALSMSSLAPPKTLQQCFSDYIKLMGLSMYPFAAVDLQKRITELNNTWLRMDFGQDWLDVLYQPIFELAMSPWWKKLLQIRSDPVYPPMDTIFNFARYCSPQQVKVVIVGQDPYPNYQAHGLAFSVLGDKIPPSLNNIFKLLTKTVPDFVYCHGDLTNWAQQGVLLLNSVLTYPRGCQGCEDFTDAVIRYIDAKNTRVVFMLWGEKAKAKSKFIKDPNHLVLETSHPGNQSAHLGFLKCNKEEDDDSCVGCNHFNRCNAFLAQHHHHEPVVIDWSLRLESGPAPASVPSIVY